MNKKILLVSLIVIAIDQFSKAIIDITMKVGQSIPVIKNFFYLTYVQNKGAAWGILTNQRYILIIISLVVLLVIYRYMHLFKMNKKNIVAFGLIVGGIVGNLIDRAIFEYVKDFLDFYIFGYNYPVFNISDCAIVIGVILLVVAIIKGEDKNAEGSSKRKLS